MNMLKCLVIEEFSFVFANRIEEVFFSQLKGARHGGGVFFFYSIERCVLVAYTRTNARRAVRVRRAIDCSVSKLDPAQVDDSSKPEK